MKRAVEVVVSATKTPVLRTSRPPELPQELALAWEGRVYELVCTTHEAEGDALLVEHGRDGERAEVVVVRRDSVGLERVVMGCSGGEEERAKTIEAASAWRGLMERGMRLGEATVLDCVPFAEGFIVPSTVLVVVLQEAHHHHQQKQVAQRFSTQSQATPLYVSDFMMEERPEIGVKAVLSGECGGEEAGGGLALLRRLGIFSGSLCLLKTQDHERLIRVHLMESVPDDHGSVLFVSPPLMLNVFGQRGLALCPHEVPGVLLKAAEATLVASKPSSAISAAFARRAGSSGGLTRPVGVASEVRLAPVGDVHNAQQLLSVKDQLLTAHFSKARLLFEGDVVLCSSGDAIVPLPSTAAYAPYLHQSEFALWKVVEIKGTGDKSMARAVHRDSCSLFVMDERQQCFLPPLAGGVAANIAASSVKFRELVRTWFTPSMRPPQSTPSVLLHSAGSGFGKRRLVHSVAQSLGISIMHYSAFEILSDVSSNTQTSMDTVFENAQENTPCIVLVSNVEAFSQSSSPSSASQRQVAQLETVLANHVAKLADSNIMFVATTDAMDKMGAKLKSAFLHALELTFPSEAERKVFFEAWIASRGRLCSIDVDAARLAARSKGMPWRNLATAVDDAARTSFESPAASAVQGVLPVMRIKDVQTGLAHVHEYTMKNTVGAPDIPNVKWADIGGMDHIRREILDTITLPLEHPELFGGQGARKRSGVLLYGPPGTGKTLIAKAVATECGLAFISVQGPELINMYVGESERNVREVFAKARAAAPCVIFMDELDSLAPRRGMGADSGGVMDRIVSQLLAELDGAASGGGNGGEETSALVFVIGATNRPDLLDPSLLRPGRLDRLLFCGTMASPEAQAAVLRALTRKFVLEKDVDLLQVARSLPLNFTGADAYALCTDAWMAAARRVMADESEEGVRVGMADFEQAVRSCAPSVSMEELRFYQKLKF